MAPGDHEFLAGAYALGAVTGQERAAFEEHLAGCAECGREIREFGDVTAMLGTAASVRPRPGLRQEVIRSASLTSQLGPVLAEPGGREAIASRPGGRPAWRRFLRPALAAVAVLVVACAGVLAAITVDQARLSQRQGQMIAAVLSASDKVMLTARVSTGGTVTVVMSHRERAVVFTGHGLRALPSGEGYELWLMGPRGERPAGMLAVRAGGMAGPTVVSGLAAGDMVGLTVEPAAGSPRPTTAPVVMIGRKTR